MWNILWILHGCIKVCGKFYECCMDVALKNPIFSRLALGVVLWFSPPELEKARGYLLLTDLSHDLQGNPRVQSIIDHKLYRERFFLLLGTSVTLSDYRSQTLDRLRPYECLVLGVVRGHLTATYFKCSTPGSVGNIPQEFITRLSSFTPHHFRVRSRWNWFPSQPCLRRRQDSPFP